MLYSPHIDKGAYSQLTDFQLTDFQCGPLHPTINTTLQQAQLSRDTLYQRLANESAKENRYINRCHIFIRENRGAHQKMCPAVFKGYP